MKIISKIFLLQIYFFIFSLVLLVYSPKYVLAVCSDSEYSCEFGCAQDYHCGAGGTCCVPDDPDPGGCSGGSCGAGACCVQGACEPKNGESCSGGGGSLCPGGTQPNPISPWPSCTFIGNPRCCCALPQSCPGNITCGTSVTVPNGECGLNTCYGPVCPPTPPSGCSANPSSCGAGRCCVSNVCGNCPSTQPPATTPPISNYANIVAYNDPGNSCITPPGGGGQGPFPYGWWVTSPDYMKRVELRCNGGACTSPFILFRERGAQGTIRINSNSTISLANFPAGYRCSDGPGCPGCSKSGVTGDIASLAPTVTFFVTNAAASPTPPPALSGWWQVSDGDVTTDGDIVSSVPNGQFFGTLGAGGFAGLPVFGGTFNLVLQNAYDKISAATSKWNANTTTEFTRIFDYSYFENLVPDDVVLNDVSTLATGTGASTYSDGYQWYKITGNHTISQNIDLGSRKVILFVKSGNLNINSRVNLTDDTAGDNGFFGAFVNGSITVSPTLTGTPAIEGIFLADNGFSTGAGTSLFHIRGSVASFGPVTLGRNLSNNATAAELFEFAPDQVMLFPEKLKYKKTKWTEVAP